MKSIKRVISNIILLMIVSCMIIPFVYMIITSLKVTYTAYNFSFSLSDITFKNYIDIFTKHNFLKFFTNSCIIVFGGVVINVLFSSLAGFAFAKKDFPGNNKIFFMYLMTLMIPSQVTMIPLYLIMRNLGWINTYKGLMLPITTALGVFLMRQAIMKIPDDLIDSARIDGCSDLRIFFLIIVPLIKPAIITLTIFTFIGAWNEFLWPLIMTTNDSVRTLTVGLSSMKAQYTVNYGLVMAGATLTFLPSFILYVLLQKKFVKGVTLSGMKG